MTIADIIELENNRKSPDSFGRIHFIKEGNFYRAHDISAWLITMMPFSEAIKNVSIIAKKLKDGYIDAFIGFPLTSLDKYIPNDGSVTFVPIRRRLLMTSDIMRYCVFNRDMTQAYDRRKFYKVNPKRGFGG